MITVSTDDHVALAKPVVWNRSREDPLCVKVNVKLTDHLHVDEIG